MHKAFRNIEKLCFYFFSITDMADTKKNKKQKET